MNEEKTYQDGLIEGREEGIRAEKINRTIIHLRNVMNGLKMGLEDTMILLLIPRAERDIYRKVFAVQNKDKRRQ